MTDAAIPGPLTGQGAVVTGAATGIGRAIAARMVQAGASVVVADIDGDRLAVAAAEIGAQWAMVDVRSHESVLEMKTAAVSMLGHVDILVCNAGVCTSAPFVDLTQTEWDRTFDVNIRGMFFCAQAFAPHMVERGSGCLLTISSVSGREGDPTLAHYAASKFAVIGFTQSFAKEFGPHGIRANAICPGAVDTEMGRRLAGEWGMSIAELAERDQVIKRPVQPEEVGDAAVFLASSQIITGQALNVDGGLVFS
jgi:meso-butanediol dehydrogenase / (S,S)-butanediol dehydrogenase / diacetyl reductase